MSEWLVARDQPRYGSQVRGNIGSGSNGSKRVHYNDASDSNSVGFSVHPIGRDAAKEKGKVQAWKSLMKSGMNSSNLRSRIWNNWKNSQKNIRRPTN
ncbi:hypothetical protein AtEden1_Chr4g0277791 [Arabidopsis thaliana]